jgi:predicted nucleic acid-binding protein
VKGLPFMRKLRVYIETTLFNYYFDTDREMHPHTVKLFKEIAAGKYEAYTSGAVITELAKAPEEKYAKMRSLIDEYQITVLSVNDEADRLADVYVTENIIPSKYRTDALHIAIAAVNDLNMIISMNFEHIVKRKTKIETEKINISNGYHAVEIFNPMEVVDNENN